MRKPAPKRVKETSLRSPNFLAILALATEMAKRLNENIAKVQLKPLGETLTAGSSKASGRTMARPAHILYVIALIGFLADSGFALGAAAGKSTPNGQSARAAEQRSTKDSAKNNAQWSADPVRGWVRADDRKKSQNTASSNVRKPNDKRTGKGKKS